MRGFYTKLSLAQVVLCMYSTMWKWQREMD